MRVFAAYPSGCLRMKKNNQVWNTLSELIKRENLYDDVKEEITLVLDTLKPLPKPGSIRVTGKNK